MSWKLYNPNPAGHIDADDCVIRAICKITGKSWDDVFSGLFVCAYTKKRMAANNKLWTEYLHWMGFRRHPLPDTCPDCYTVSEFARDHPQGSYILATGTHLVAVVNGDWYDIFDSGGEIPLSYWQEGGTA